MRETREKLEALRNELKNAENVIRFRVREGWFKLDLAIREERLYTKKIRELSRLSAEVTGLRYEAGVAEMRDVIEFNMTWFEARLTSERKKSEIEIARADLEEIDRNIVAIRLRRVGIAMLKKIPLKVILAVLVALMLIIGVSWRLGYQQGANKPSSGSSGSHKLLFYRNPMNPAITSPVPAKDEMGMDYIPVYEDDAKAPVKSVAAAGR